MNPLIRILTETERQRYAINRAIKEEQKEKNRLIDIKEKYGTKDDI